jgi:hypothetical protein
MANMHHDANIDNPDVQHEESDINIRAIFGFGLALVVVAVVIHIGIYFLFVFFSTREASAKGTRNYPLAAGQENRVPPEPRLQTAPRQDLRDLRAAEEQILGSYRWVDRNAGIVSIPIGEAMRLTLQRGLPARPAPADQSRQPPAPQQPSKGTGK